MSNQENIKTNGFHRNGDHTDGNTDNPLARQEYKLTDALEEYKRQASKTKLLTPKQEILLSKEIRSGGPLAEKARDLMIRANLRLVIKIARNYEGLGMPLLDLISEGNIGLMKGVDRFNPKKGGKLSTYASFWIKQCIRRALADQARTIRMPVHAVDALFKIGKAAKNLEEQFGRAATNEEIAEVMGMAPEKVAGLRTANMRPLSLDEPISDEADSATNGEIIADDSAELSSEVSEWNETRAMIADCLQELDERERTVIQLRFGFTGDRDQTLKEVGLKFGVTRERIRQIQNMALAKLRSKLDKRERGPSFIDKILNSADS